MHSHSFACLLFLFSGLALVHCGGDDSGAPNHRGMSGNTGTDQSGSVGGVIARDDGAASPDGNAPADATRDDRAVSSTGGSGPASGAGSGGRSLRAGRRGTGLDGVFVQDDPIADGAAPQEDATEANDPYDGGLCPPETSAPPANGSACNEPVGYDADAAAWTCTWPASGISCDCVRNAASGRRWECSAGDARSDAAEPTYLSEEEAGRLAGVIRSVTVEGDLCPAGSWVLDNTGSGSAAQVTLSTEWAGPSTGVESCTLTVEMDLPTGYQMTAPFVALRGGASGNASLRRSYWFEGGGNPSSMISTLPDDSFELYDLASGVWSPSCGDAHRVRFAANLQPQLLAESNIALASIDIATDWRHSGVEWRACGDSEPVMVGPAGAGHYCAGFHQRACSGDLICEFSGLENGREGTCVDPTEIVPPRQRDDSCDGVRNMQCESGLVCLHLSQAEIDQKVTGTCSPAIGDQGDICTTQPQTIPCKEGLFCIPTVYASAEEHGRCTVADGAKNSWCGAAGMPKCKDDLVCNQDHRCAIPRGHLGASCLLPDVGCDEPLQCVQNTCVAP